MALGYPFSYKAYFKAETTYSGGATGVGLIISDKILNIKLESGDMYKALRGISSPSVCGYISTPSDYSLHLEWIEQENPSSLASFCIERITTTGDLRSLCFDIGANATAGTKSYWLVKGAKCKTFTKKASTGNEYICTADFSVASFKTGTAATLTAPAALGTAYAQFNKVGNVIYKNTNSNIATIVDNIEITINNNLTDYWIPSLPWKQASIPGACDITGTVDISLDDGGKTFWDAMWLELTNILINTGQTNYNKWTLSNVRWDPQTIDITTGNDMLKTGAKFRAKKLAITSGA